VSTIENYEYEKINEFKILKNYYDDSQKEWNEERFILINHVDKFKNK
jgi:hypothetical protein